MDHQKVQNTVKNKAKNYHNTKSPFQVVCDFSPAGDQPQAIESLVQNFEKLDHQTLLGVTGSGKTFTMAHIIQKLNLPTLVLAHNKTLAAQLFTEFKSLFPHNAVEYFVSYYDYYQPEAYLPASDTFIEKDSSINDQIDRMRHSATHSLFERNDVVIVSSVSCIYGLGSPEAYKEMKLSVKVNEQLKRDTFLKELVRILYDRNDIDFHRGTFRVKGDVVDIHPPYEEDRAIRVEFFGNYIDQISWIDPVRGTILSHTDIAHIYPGSHHVNTEEITKRAITSIQKELQVRLQELNKNIRLLEAQRLEQRTCYDIEMIEEMGFCHGIENYSRHFTGRKAGQPPPTLLEYFPKEFLCIVDESHMTIPQLRAMSHGDRSRKTTLVEHGFRLASALDNRPLNFDEFNHFLNKTLYVSATPGDYEFQKSLGCVVEQIIRPTGLLDPVVEVRPAKYQVDDLLPEIKKVIQRQERVLITTLTKKSAEDLSEYYESIGLRVKYLHSDIKTVERTEILRDLRLRVFDILVGINLLREGLDLPEVSLVAVLDADKEGFLRSAQSLIQTMGRAARNVNGRVILYADVETDSIKKAMAETRRRRKIQEAYNQKHNITPQTIQKNVAASLTEVYSHKDFSLVTSIDLPDQLYKKYKGQPAQISKDIKKLKSQMQKASRKLEFEEAARLRDEIKRLEVLDLEIC